MGDDEQNQIESSKKKITVCVCTYNNYNKLHGVLMRLANQSVGTELYNVIVLDNGPDHSSTKFDLCKKFTTLRQNFRYVIKQTNGLSGARNDCILLTDTELIHFVDDDTLPDFNFIKNTIKCFEKHKNLSVVGGKVIPNWSEVVRPNWMCKTALGYLSMLDFGDTEQWYDKIDGMWLVGANICFRKSILEKYGGFSTELGRKGWSRSLLGSEEMDLVYKMNSDNEKILYSPEIIVEHIVPSDRTNKNWFLRRVAWQAASDVMTNTTYLQNAGPWSNNKPGYQFIKDNIHLLFVEPKNAKDFDELLKLVKILSFWLLNDFKKNEK